MEPAASNPERVSAVNMRNFWILVTLSLLGYLGLAVWFPLRPYFNLAPSPDIRSLAPTVPRALIYAALLCLLYGLYLLAYRLVHAARRSLPLATILITAALFSLPLVFSFPANATDVYRYFIRGRITAVHRLNPFTVAAADVPEEPFTPLAGEWAEFTSPYGPLWEVTAALAAKVIQDDLWQALIIYKALAAILHLAIAAAIYYALPNASSSRRSGIALLWAWNPALLLIFAVNGHNDSLMMLWLMLGWLSLAHGRLYLGITLLFLAPLTKPIGLLPLPFIFLSCWRQLASLRSRIFFPIFTVVMGLVLTFLVFTPFGSPIQLAERLLGEAGTGGGFSLSALLILQLRAWGLDPSVSLTTQIGAVLLALLALWLLWLTWNGRSSLRAAADTYGGYIIQAFRFRIWYAAWPFPWLLLDFGYAKLESVAARARLMAGLTFLLTSQLSVIVYGQIRTGLLAGSQLAAHLIGVSLTFLVPVVVGLAYAVSGERLGGRQKER